MNAQPSTSTKAPFPINRIARTALAGLLTTAAVTITTVVVAPGAVSAASGVVNTYVAATVTGNQPDSSGLDPNDCALVIQMTGSPATGLGVHEILDPANSAPTRTYSNTEQVQFVVLPGGCDSNIVVEAAGVTPKAWDGTTGGVVFLGGNALTLNGDITADGAGYTPLLAPGAGSDGESGLVSSAQNRTGGFLADGTAGGAGGGGGIFGGGGGGGGTNHIYFDSNNAMGGTGGSVTAAGVGGLQGTHTGDGGDPGAPGNGGNSPNPGAMKSSSANHSGAGGGGGGSYGAGGGACGSHLSSAYAAGGGGGGSWLGGGAGGPGGTNRDATPVNPTGGFGNAPQAEITFGDHYLNPIDPRLMMGGAGGDHMEGLGGGAGGGIVFASFDSISGGGNSISADGANGASPAAGPSSGAGGGAGGQMYIGTGSMSALTTTANGGGGGSFTLGATHAGSYGAPGGGGGIWFDGAASSPATNTGANTTPAAAGTVVGLAGVDFAVLPGGSAQITAPQGTVSIGSTIYTQAEWTDAYNLAGIYSLANGIPMLPALVDTLPAAAADILAEFPSLITPNNPKSTVTSTGCGPGLGGAGLVSATPGPVSPAIDVEKDTNGNQADTIAAQDGIATGAPVTWSFVITNDGDTDLSDVRITDAVVIDNGTTPASGIVCDWVNSSDAATPARNLSVDETVTCTATSTAASGQYGNLATAVGTPVADAETADPDSPSRLVDRGSPVPDVDDTDPSHYFGTVAASIDVEKDTNGNQADTIAAQDGYDAGDAITWTFVITNDGAVDLSDVRIDDTVVIDNGTPAASAIVCDWTNSTDAATPARNLSVGETVTCSSTSSAVFGQYGNLADVAGTPVADAETADPDAPVRLSQVGIDLADVVDDDPSHYFGEPVPSIDVEKDTNGNQADTIAAQDGYDSGDAITWTFVITNDGQSDLSDVRIDDTVVIDNGSPAASAIVCDWTNSTDAATPARNLSVGESVTCTSSSTAALGQYGNLADVAGTPVADAETADPDAPIRLTKLDGSDLADVVDDDPSHYFGDAAPSIDVEKDTNGNQADTIAAQDSIAVDDAITWSFVITNDGQSDLSDVRIDDTVVIDNGTPAASAIVCDWTNSTDAATPARNLSVGESVTCTSTSTAASGQYGNLATVAGVPVADASTADPDAPVRRTDASGTPLVDPTDTDPSHYFGLAGPSIDVEKFTNGNQADTIAAQDGYDSGDVITWTFDIVNDGQTDLSDVSIADAVVIDNGSPAASAIVCDWTNSSDPATPARNLSVGETVTCSSSSTATLGQYGNLATVVGTPVADAVTADPDNPTRLTQLGNPLADVDDTDPSHYFGGPTPSIDVEKSTNGNQADVTANQDSIPVGDAVVWTFVITNDGQSDLADVTISDAVAIDNGTPTASAIVCDWTNSTDPATPTRNLSVGESVTCRSSSTAALGQYGNLASVTGVPVADASTADPDAPVRLTDASGAPLVDPTDEDPSHYFGSVVPAIDIEKTTNDNQADTRATQDEIPFGQNIVWEFVVKNTGGSDLAAVTVTDAVVIDNGTPTPSLIACNWATSSDPATPARNLSVGETVVCESGSTAALGQYGNLAEVTGTPVADATTANPDAPVRLNDASGAPLVDPTDDDPSHYFGSVAPSIDIEKATNGTQADTIAEQDTIVVGDDVTWTFAVTNDGTVDLAGVTVTDSVTIDNGTVTTTEPPCDWANSSDPATPDRNLAVGESVTCTSTSTAATGQYGNLAEVTGTPVADAETADADAPVSLTDVSGEDIDKPTDDDPSHYFGGLFDLALRIRLADGTNERVVAVGDQITFQITIFNQGNMTGQNVEVVNYIPDGLSLDDPAWTLATDPAGGAAATISLSENIAPGESIVITITFVVNDGMGGEAIVNIAEIAAAEPVDARGVVLLHRDGSAVVDIDSVPDRSNDEIPVDDEIANALDDEDDHDIALVRVREHAVAVPELPRTGDDSPLTMIRTSVGLALLGIALLLGTRGRRDRSAF